MEEYFKINLKEIEKIIEESRKSERKRFPKIIRGFRDKDTPSAMFNALQLGTYIRPHKHPSEKGKEILIANKGKSIAVFFNESGRVTNSFILSLSETNYLEVPPKTYHTVIALEPDTILCEIYMANHQTDAEYKEFAPWAPEERTPEVEKYIEKISKEALLLAN